MCTSYFVHIGTGSGEDQSIKPGNIMTENHVSQLVDTAHNSQCVARTVNGVPVNLRRTHTHACACAANGEIGWAWSRRAHFRPRILQSIHVCTVPVHTHGQTFRLSSQPYIGRTRGLLMGPAGSRPCFIARSAHTYSSTYTHSQHGQVCFCIHFERARTCASGPKHTHLLGDVLLVAQHTHCVAYRQLQIWVMCACEKVGTDIVCASVFYLRALIIITLARASTSDESIYANYELSD